MDYKLQYKCATPVPSLWKLAFNTLLCILLLVLIYFVFNKWRYFPYTLTFFISILLSEVNYQRNSRRIKRYIWMTDEKEGLKEDNIRVGSIAAIVGYREDPTLFRRCLESYNNAESLEFMIVAVDGNESADMEMVDIFSKTFPNDSVVIPIKEPFGPLAMKLSEEYLHRNGNAYYTVEDAEEFSFHTVYQLAISILRQFDVIDSARTVKRICLHQPHLCKKDIMFTAFVFSLAIGHVKGIEFLWSSDSDSLINSDSIILTMACMALDRSCAGASSGLSIHNIKDSTVTQLAGAMYWSNFSIIRGQTSSVGAADIQPGPCAAFRLGALPSILLPWYKQKYLGVRTVVNEDRHLTTNLLMRGWKVTYCTHAVVETDTPATMVRWLLQQIRWGRAMHIETLGYPIVFAIHGPVLFLSALERTFAPLAIFFFTIRYLVTGKGACGNNLTDIFLRALISCLYSYIRNRQKLNGILWLILSQFFYQIQSPGITLWSLLTILEGGWGTSMRSPNELSKKSSTRRQRWWSTGFVIGWVGTVGAVFGKLVASQTLPSHMSEIAVISALITILAMHHVLFRDV